MKLKRLFNGKNNNNGIEISGSFGGQASDENLLGNDTVKSKENQWNAWSSERNNDVNANRGRSSSRLGLRRSSSERPSLRKRSKSEVGKRLKKLGDDIGAKMTKVAGSKSVGGTFKGRTRDVDSRIDSLALERADSETRLQQSSFDSLFGQSQSERTERTCMTTTTQSKKKLRGGRRKSTVDDSDVSKSGESGTRQRSKSTSTRNKRSSSTVSTSRRRRSSSALSKSGRAGSSSDVSISRRKRSSSAKPRKSTKDVSDSASIGTKESTTKKKKKKKSDKEKKKKSKDGSDASEVSSIPSNVEMDEESQGNSSVTMNDSVKGKKKKTKDKEKSKKSKPSKSKIKFPEFPADDFGDGLEGLAEEFRRSKNNHSEEKAEQGVSDYPSNGVPNTSNGGKLFESAWNEIEQSTTEIKRSNSIANDKNLNPFEDEKKQNPVDFEVKRPGISEQQEEILKLQQQLSTALQKHLTMSEEHIKEKNEFMNVSRDLERMRVELMQSQEEQHEVIEELKERDRIIEEDKNKIDNLEHAVDEQLGKEEELMKNAQQSEEEIEHLLEEIQKFETKLEAGETGGGGASFGELRNAKKALAERDEYVASQKLKIEQLEEELKDSITVPQLQIAELDQENKALQGRLKGERLEYTSKLTTKDDIIQSLRTDLATYTASPDAQDLQSALQKLTDAREDATSVRGDLAAAVKKIEELHGEREDFMEEFNLLKDNNVFMEKTVKDLTEKADGLAKKVLVWTEKTYDWKQRAETAERKIKEAVDDKEKTGSETGKSDAPGDPQGMFLEAAMEKEKSGQSGSWGIFKRNSAQTKDLSAEEVRIRVLEEQNLEFEAKIAQLNSDLVKMQTGHKDELYTTKKKIAQLEGENEVLALQNSTLEQLREG